MRRSSVTSLRLMFATLVSMIAVALAGSPVSAHAGFDFSVPTDGASVGDVLSEVTVAFTEPVTMVGNGFEVLDPQGNTLEPFAVTDDDMVFRLQFDPPLAGGPVAVSYEVTSVDGHVVAGDFQFTVSVDLPPTTVASTSVPATSAQSGSVVPAGDEELAMTTSTPATAAAEPIAAPTSAVAIVTVADAEDTSSSNGVYVAIAAAVALAAGAFLVIRSRMAR